MTENLPFRHCLLVMLFNAIGLICPAMSFAGTELTLPSGAKVTIDEQPFDKASWKVESCGAEMPACLVNGHIAFGAAFQLPKTYLKKITVTVGGKVYDLDSTSMFDAWGTRPLQVKGAVRYFGGACSSPGNCRFRGLFSDGAGSFVAEWLIVEGHSTRTVLTDISDVIQLFTKEIDPPVID